VPVRDDDRNVGRLLCGSDELECRAVDHRWLDGCRVNGDERLEIDGPILVRLVDCRSIVSGVIVVIRAVAGHVCVHNRGPVVVVVLVHMRVQVRSVERAKRERRQHQVGRDTLTHDLLIPYAG
jgi:hypothetical protein